jgi:hypothetical protein
MLNPRTNEINFNATKMITMIDFNKADLQEHPLTKNISTELITSYSKMKCPPKTPFPFPCHTQGTERFIPLISESADQVSDRERDGYILATINSRNLNSSNFTKLSYNPAKFMNYDEDD